MSFDELIQSLKEKLAYTEKHINEIQEAINKQGICVDEYTPLKEYAYKISLILGQIDKGIQLSEYLRIADNVNTMKFENIIKQDFIESILPVFDNADIIYHLEHTEIDVLDLNDNIEVTIPNRLELIPASLLTISDSVIVEVTLK